MAGKNLKIETLRGAAILLIALGHVIGSAPDGGMQIDYPSPWRYWYFISASIRLPVITAIAGWVYALKPIDWGGLLLFVRSKVNRLLIPMFIVGACYLIIQYLVPGTNNAGDLSQLWRLLIFPYNYFWYLYSLFVILVAVAIVDAQKWIDSAKSWFVVLLICFLLTLIEKNIIPYSVPNIFGFKGAMMLCPYFMAGLGIQRFSAVVRKKNLQVGYGVMAVIGLVLLQLQWQFDYGISYSVYSAIQPIFAIPLLPLLFFHIPNIPFFSWIGRYSYTIYLYHGFGTAGGRIILSFLGIHQQIPVFLFASVVAIAIPIVVELVLSRNKVMAFFFLGKKYKTLKR